VTFERLHLNLYIFEIHKNEFHPRVFDVSVFVSSKFLW